VDGDASDLLASGDWALIVFIVDSHKGIEKGSPDATGPGAERIRPVRASALASLLLSTPPFVSSLHFFFVVAHWLDPAMSSVVIPAPLLIASPMAGQEATQQQQPQQPQQPTPRRVRLQELPFVRRGEMTLQEDKESGDA